MIGLGSDKNGQTYRINKEVQAHREQTWRKQRRSGGEAHQMAGSATQRFFRFMYIYSFFLFFPYSCCAGKINQSPRSTLTLLAIQAASWSLGMWWRRSLPRYIGLELLIYIVLYYTLQLVYRLSTNGESEVD